MLQHDLHVQGKVLKYLGQFLSGTINSWNDRYLGKFQVVKTVTATKFRHEPFQDFYEVFEEIGRWEQGLIEV